MKTSIRSVLILSAMVCLGSLFVAQRHLGLVRAQPPLTSQLEYRVDNTVRERGIVESANSIDVRCEVPGTSTILHLIPEGSRVEKGDLLVELDSAALTEQLAGAEVRVEQARAQVVQSKAELDSTQGDGEAAIQFAEMALEAASASREKVLADGGELTYELTVTQSELTIANARPTGLTLLEGTTETSSEVFIATCDMKLLRIFRFATRQV